MTDMRNCGECGGPTAHCLSCNHYHCDDEMCTGFPVSCAYQAWVRP